LDVRLYIVLTLTGVNLLQRQISIS